MSIGAVKGVEIGSGFGAARSKGSENHDNGRVLAVICNSALLLRDRRGWLYGGPQDNGASVAYAA